jgi:hypothetical protein
MIGIQVEAFTDGLFDEMLPLIQKCWKECTQIKGETCAYYGEREFDVEPDLEGYKGLARLGSLVVVCLREDGLKGYAAGFTYPSLHHRKVLGCIGDTIYIETGYRDHMGAVIDRFLREMTSRKADIIGWPVGPRTQVHKLLKERGFVRDDIVMEKRLFKESVCASLRP